MGPFLKPNSFQPKIFGPNATYGSFNLTHHRYSAIKKTLNKHYKSHHIHVSCRYWDREYLLTIGAVLIIIMLTGSGEQCDNKNVDVFTTTLHQKIVLVEFQLSTHSIPWMDPTHVQLWTRTVCRTSATHKLGLHDIVEESFEKLKNSDSDGDAAISGTSKMLCFALQLFHIITSL